MFYHGYMFRLCKVIIRLALEHFNNKIIIAELEMISHFYKLCLIFSCRFLKQFVKLGYPF
jgi:hypothetical protein